MPVRPQPELLALPKVQRTAFKITETRYNPRQLLYYKLRRTKPLAAMLSFPGKSFHRLVAELVHIFHSGTFRRGESLAQCSWGGRCSAGASVHVDTFCPLDSPCGSRLCPWHTTQLLLLHCTFWSQALRHTPRVIYFSDSRNYTTNEEIKRVHLFTSRSPYCKLPRGML